MEPTNENVSLHLRQAEGTAKPLPDTTTKNHPHTQSSHLAGVMTRVCPYCESTIPASEDPCHACGHLEPAVYPDQPVADAGGSRVIRMYVVFMATMYLFYGIAMIIAPDANPSPDYDCDLSAADDCFLPFVIWSRPGGILSVCISLFILFKAAGWKSRGGGGKAGL